MTHLRRELARLKEYHQVAEIGEIARRYFAMNSFDGILTILGVLTGNFLARVSDPTVIVLTGLTTSVSMAVSGLWGAYLTESAERQRGLDDLEEHTLSDLSGTRIGRAARVAVAVVALVDGLAPLLASVLVLLPFFLTSLWGSITVSYTHLRAHETVLDPVCRLLLEKTQDKHFPMQPRNSSPYLHTILASPTTLP